jgi:hypothetical protein
VDPEVAQIENTQADCNRGIGGEASTMPASGGLPRSIGQIQPTDHSHTLIVSSTVYYICSCFRDFEEAMQSGEAPEAVSAIMGVFRFLPQFTLGTRA